MVRRRCVIACLLALVSTWAAACSTVLSADGDGTSTPASDAQTSAADGFIDAISDGGAGADGASDDGKAPPDAASDVIIPADPAPGCTGGSPLFCEDFDPTPGTQTYPGSVTEVGGTSGEYVVQIAGDNDPPSPPNGLTVTWKANQPKGVMVVTAVPILQRSGQKYLVARFRMNVVLASSAVFFMLGKSSAPGPSLRLFMENDKFSVQVGTDAPITLLNVGVSFGWHRWSVAVIDNGAASEIRVAIDGDVKAKTTAEVGLAASVRFGVGASAINPGATVAMAQTFQFDDVRAD